MSTLFPTVPQPRRTVCLIKCGRGQSQPGLTCTFYLSFCLSEEFKCIMNKGVVIWNIIPLHWWNYKDGESSQIMLIVFYHERCPCWGCGARRKGRPWMNSDSTVTGLGVQHSLSSVHLPVLEDAKGALLLLLSSLFLCSRWTHKDELEAKVSDRHDRQTCLLSRSKEIMLLGRSQSTVIFFT